jgi:hypothetical protein
VGGSLPGQPLADRSRAGPRRSHAASLTRARAGPWLRLGAFVDHRTGCLVESILRVD